MLFKLPLSLEWTPNRLAAVHVGAANSLPGEHKNEKKKYKNKKAKC